MTIQAALTTKQEAFVTAFVELRNATEAYRRAYDCTRMSPNTIGRNAYELQRVPHVRQEIDDRLEAARALANANIAFTVQDALVRLLETATADPDELIGLRVGCCRHCYGENHAYQWADHEYMAAVAKVEKENARPERKGPESELPDIAGGFGWNHTLPPVEDCPVCQGEGVERIVARDTSRLSRGARLLYRGVKQTRNGIEIMLADQDKALQDAIRIIGGFDDRLKVEGRIATVFAEAKTPAEATKAYAELLKAGRIDATVKKG